MEDHQRKMADVRKHRDVRSTYQEIKRLTDVELLQRMQSMKINTNGSREIQQDRLLRAWVLQQGLQLDVPWYEWDNEGDIPEEVYKTLLPLPRARTTRRKSPSTRSSDSEQDQ